MTAAMQHRSHDHPVTMDAEGRIFDEEFTCPVCLDLMVHPTMLPCGHNLCYLCLAKRTLATRRRTCPTCQQGWQGRPTINLALRNRRMERMHQVSLLRRELHPTFDLDTSSVLATFSTAVNEAEKRTKENEAVAFFWFGIAIAACAILVPQALHCWYSTLMYPGDPLTQKPVMAWRSSDVTLWLENMGWPRDYCDITSVHQHNINGAMLLGMNETDIVQLLNMTDTVHQNALQAAIQNLYQASLKMPENVWEYLEIYPGRVHFLSLFLLQAPRSTMVFMYLFYYEEMFLPLLQTTTPVEWDKQTETQGGQLPDPSKSQWVDFAVWTLVLPYWTIVVFAWGYRWQHYFLLLYVIPRSFLESVQEICLCLRVSLGWNVGYPYNAKQTAMDDMQYRLFILLAWPVIPLFALNGWMYIVISFGTLVNGWAICNYLQSNFRVYQFHQD